MAMQYINLGKGERGWPAARVKLDGRFYKVEVVWNNIEGVWSLNLYNATGQLMRGGMWLRHNEDCLAAYTGAEFPGNGRGKIKPWDQTGADGDPGRLDLGRPTTNRLVYIPEADVLASEGAS